MKHLIILFVLAVAGYAAWQVASPAARLSATSFAKKHVTAITFIAAVLFALVAAAAAFPSTSIL